jgi:D-glycero-D-manno-heptose 1,7-bisphosphate phosphatase
MRLLPGVGAALQQLRAAGFACVVVTNQSVVGRGMITEAELAAIHDEMLRQMRGADAWVDGIYAATAMTEHPDRKPAPGLLLRAALELQLDLANSWMVGDSLRDIQAGRAAGCKGCVLVRTGHAIDEAALAEVMPLHIAKDLQAATTFILQS